jgi:hypothetical protein
MGDIESKLRTFWTGLDGTPEQRAASFAMLCDDAIPHPPTKPRADGRTPCCYAPPRAVECCNEPTAHGSAHCEEHRPKYRVENLSNGGVNYTLISGHPVSNRRF